MAHLDERPQWTRGSELPCRPAGYTCRCGGTPGSRRRIEHSRVVSAGRCQRLGRRRGRPRNPSVLLDPALLHGQARPTHVRHFAGRERRPSRESAPHARCRGSCEWYAGPRPQRLDIESGYAECLRSGRAHLRTGLRVSACSFVTRDLHAGFLLSIRPCAGKRVSAGGDDLGSQLVESITQATLPRPVQGPAAAGFTYSGWRSLAGTPPGESYNLPL